MSDDYYSHYKPLRNLSKKFEIVDTVLNCWLLSQHILNNRPLPYNYSKFARILASIKPFPIWELSIVLAEVILNSDKRNAISKTLGKHDDFAEILNTVKKVCNDFSEIHLKDEGNVLFTLHRIPHQQFFWQSRGIEKTLTRYYKIYNTTCIETHFIKKLGVSQIGITALLLELIRHFNHHQIINLNLISNKYPNYSQPIFEYLKKITIDLVTLQQKLKENQRIDDSWEYTFNPVIQFPLVTLNSGDFEKVLCPFPFLLQRRLTNGLYFDIVDESRNFSDAFGMSFQNYVGELLRAVFSSSIFQVTEESEFMMGKKIKHGIDWILSDGTANIFIECKTKRLRSKGMVDFDSDELRSDIEILSTAIVQTYKNITLATSGNSNWIYDNKPVFPLVITLEDWHIISPVMRAKIDEAVRLKLDSARMSSELLVSMPYTISSIESFESASRAIQEKGINHFMSVKVNDEYRNWDISNFSNFYFKDIESSKDQIFPNDFQSLLGKILDFCNQKTIN